MLDLQQFKGSKQVPSWLAATVQRAVLQSWRCVWVRGQADHRLCNCGSQILCLTLKQTSGWHVFTPKIQCHNIWLFNTLLTSASSSYNSMTIRGGSSWMYCRSPLSSTRVISKLWFHVGLNVWLITWQHRHTHSHWATHLVLLIHVNKNVDTGNGAGRF